YWTDKQSLFAIDLSCDDNAIVDGQYHTVILANNYEKLLPRLCVLHSEVVREGNSDIDIYQCCDQPTTIFEVNNMPQEMNLCFLFDFFLPTQFLGIRCFLSLRNKLTV